jgi:hypothetical protein
MDTHRQFLVASLAVFLLMVGCAPEQGSSSGSSVAGVATTATDAKGLAVFKSGLYAFVNAQGCVKCHASVVHPNFAASDATVAYAQAKGMQIGSSLPLIDFANPAASIFITYAGNSHCGDTPCSNPAVRPAVQAALVAWANAELASSAPPVSNGPAAPKFLTGSLPIPMNLPRLMMAPTVMRFPLSGLVPAVASLSKAILEIEVQAISPTEYHVGKPKIAGNTAAVNLTGIHVFVKTSATTSSIGAEDTSQGNLWATSAVMATIFALPAKLPTTPLGAMSLEALPLNIQALSTADAFTIGFDDIH